MNKAIILSLSLMGVAGLSACSDQEPSGGKSATMAQGPVSAIHKSMRPAKPVTRWYSKEQVARGNQLFQQNCAQCHRPDASGDPNWKQVNAEGKLPPPPLNGTGHAWHHPMPLLQQVVRRGGIPMGGSMPPFADKLNAEQINDILAWVQSHWPDGIYAKWAQMTAQQAARKKQG
jgi:mono/diheme cytochrome c family protein